jgi:hypothetical protein
MYPMPDYRAYRMTIEGVALDMAEFHCEEDEARKRASKLAEATATPVELWDGPRRIARFEPQRERG